MNIATHIKEHGMTVAEYRGKFNIPVSISLVHEKNEHEIFLEKIRAMSLDQLLEEERKILNSEKIYNYNVGVRKCLS